ncbi:MAG: hypothetical protein HZA63_10395 [Rhodocyclales bacterium]|nr:hypothetical protein [Rhodocyclales bacterium]
MQNVSANMKELSEGDVDPSLGKTVKFLVLQTEQFIVYLDSNLDIQWSHSDELKTDQDFGLVLNRVAYLEAKARFINEREVLQSIKRLIAEGIARYLEYSSVKMADQIHDLADAQIGELNVKTSWSWYFDAAYGLTLACLALWGVVWLSRDFITPYLGRTGLEVVLGGLIGSVGAMISVISRGNKLSLDANAGKTIHVTEGIARIVVGIAGALLVALAYKGGILLAGVKFFGSNLAVLLSLSIVAGASERLVPSLIAKVESSVTAMQGPPSKKRKGFSDD